MRIINEKLIEEFRAYLINSEKSRATIDKYMHDIRTLADYFLRTGQSGLSKEMMLEYKEYLGSRYRSTSANSMLAAANVFLKLNGWDDCVVKPFRLQREAFRKSERDLTRGEYKRLLCAARKKGNDRLALVMETICSSGIRVGELKYITVEAVMNGTAEIHNKGKTRTVLLVPQLCKKLRRYARSKGITSGPVFITRSGNTLDRSNILHEMKALNIAADVLKNKIFPHNLRHLFAVTYYRVEKDLAHLADILGHSSVNTTRIYTACSRFEQIRVIQKLGLVT